MCETSEANKAYIAGFIDGEGSICIIKSGLGYMQLQIQINQMDKRPLDFINSHYKGYLHQVNISKTSYSKQRKTWRLVYHEKNAIKLLSDIQDKLVLKSKQAKLALQFLKFKREKTKVQYSDKERKTLRAFKNKMHILNGTRK